VDGADSGSHPVAGFGISGFEPSGSTTRELVKILTYCHLSLLS
jgi:hypothetical protein